MAGQLPGRAPSRDLPADLVIDDRLRGPALAEDWAGWRRAWTELDAGPIAQWAARHAGEPGASLTLCGERGSLTWTSGGAAPIGRLLRGLAAAWRPARAAAVLEAL